MDTRFLRSFLAVARRGSFTDAALELGITQSTVTSHLQKLERQLGVLLLDRLPGGTVVTDAGARLTGLAEEVLLAEERLRTAASPQGGRPSGTVRLMAPETLCTYWLPAVVSAVSRAEPDVQIWVSPGGLADALDSVRRGAVDLAVTMEPFMPGTDLDLTRIGRQPLVFIDQSEAPDGDSGTRQPATWDELARRDALLIEEGCGYSDHVADQLASARRPSGRRSRFGSVESIKRCVAVGLGWTVLPGIAVESELRARTLRLLEGPALPDCEIHVVSHPRRHRSPAAGVVLDELSRSCPAASGGYLSGLRDSRM